MEMRLGCGFIQFHCCRNAPTWSGWSGPDTVPHEVMSCTECIYKHMLCLTLFTHSKMPINNNNCALVHLFLSPQHFKPSLLFIVCSVGNASPLAIRSTTYCVPRDGQMVLLSRLPLGALVTPLVKQNAGEVGLIKIWMNRNKVQPIYLFLLKTCLHIGICIYFLSLAFRRPFLCATTQTVLLVAVGAVRRCVLRWAGRTVGKGFTAPSVGNSVKVFFFFFKAFIVIV